MVFVSDFMLSLQANEISSVYISLGLFPFQPVPHNWYTKGRGIYYPLCGIVHIKDPLLSVGTISPLSGGNGFLISLCCILPYVQYRYNRCEMC